jgi:hypothetical protein
MKKLVTGIFLLFFLANGAQNCSYLQDTLYIPKQGKIVNTEYLQTTLKNNTIVKLYKTENSKYFLKLIVTENLYFDKVDVLEIKSGSKSYYEKDAKHFQYDKHTGFYVLEIYKNYIGTLKEDGITSIVFGKSETNFTKQDCNQIKQISKCFYENIVAKNKK